MLPVVLGLHVVWRELVLRQILTGVDGACRRRRICEFSLGGYRGVLDASPAPTSDGSLVVVRVRYSGSTCGWCPRRDQSQRKP